MCHLGILEEIKSAFIIERKSNINKLIKNIAPAYRVTSPAVINSRKAVLNKLRFIRTQSRLKLEKIFSHFRQFHSVPGIL